MTVRGLTEQGVNSTFWQQQEEEEGSCLEQEGEMKSIFIQLSKELSTVCGRRERGSKAKRGCRSLVMVIVSCCQTEIINTIFFNKKIPAVYAFGSHSILKTYQAIYGRDMWYTLESCNPRHTLKERCDRVCGYGSVQSS